jgi:superfamily I DNA and RNA helicase
MVAPARGERGDAMYFPTDSTGEGPSMAGERAASAMASLNVAQRSAVTAPAHAILQILAGPGSGKTNVLTHRVCFLLEQGMKPENIILTTFTNVTNTPSEFFDK